jgi:hypothetical protein
VKIQFFHGPTSRQSARASRTPEARHKERVPFAPHR